MPEIEPEAVSAAEKISPMLKIKIVEQIEYYFGDFNMMRDKFLKQEITKDDGWVPVSTLLRFNRLAALSKDVDVIMSAFEDHQSSIVEVNAITQCVRRNPDRPVPEQGDSWRNTIAERTVYVKGFPLESTTLDDILNFMSTFGKVDNVFKRSYFDKALKQWKFKGSVYVAFPTKEEGEKFMSIGTVKFRGNELIRKWQNDYIEEKKNERIKSKLEAKETKNQLLKEQQEGIVRDMKKLPEGALIKVSGLKEGISLIELKMAAIKLGWDVGFVDYTSGETTAYIRLQEENSAKDVLAKLTDNSFELKGVTVKAELVEGDEEKELLEKMEAERKSRIMQNVAKQGKKGKGKKHNGPKFGKQDKNEVKADIKDEKVECKEEKMETENGDSSVKVEKTECEAETSDPNSEITLKRKKDDEDPTDESSSKKSKAAEE